MNISIKATLGLTLHLGLLKDLVFLSVAGGHMRLTCLALRFPHLSYFLGILYTHHLFPGAYPRTSWKDYWEKS